MRLFQPGHWLRYVASPFTPPALKWVSPGRRITVIKSLCVARLKMRDSPIPKALYSGL